MTNLVIWLNSNEGAVMACLTFVYVVATIFIVISNNRIIKETKLVREQQSMPRIVIGVDCIRQGLLVLVVINEGASTSYKLKISINEEFLSCLEKRFAQRIRNLGSTYLTVIPKQRIEYTLGGPAEHREILQRKIIGSIKYEDKLHKEYFESFKIDLEGQLPSLVPDAGTHEIYEQLKKINESLLKVTSK